MANLLISKLKACTPQYYKLVWDGKLNEPIRHKINTPNLAIEVLNNIWTEVLAKYNGSDYIICDKYTRLNVNYMQESIAILVYPNGTIMYQGNTVVSWADSHLENICKEVQMEVKNNEPQINCCKEDSPTNSNTEIPDKLPNPSVTTLHKSNPTEPLDLSISNKDSSSPIFTDSPDDKMNNSSTSQPLDSSSSLELSGMKSFLDSSESSISPEFNDIENISNKSPSIEMNEIQNKSVSVTKASCKRSLNFDNSTPSSGELNISNRRYPATFSITPDPSSTSIRSSYDSFCNIFPPSGTRTMNSSNRQTQELSCTEKEPESETDVHTQEEEKFPESETNPHTQNEEMIVHIQKLEQEKCDLELEIKSLKEKLKYYDETAEISQHINEQKTQSHRLDHRSPTVIIKEFRKMEEVLKVTQQKLHDSIEEKKKLNQQISSLNIKGKLPNSADINKIPEYLQLKSDYDRLCGRQKILELKYETESNNQKGSNLRLIEECNALRTKLEQKENIIKNMNDAYELANDKIENMSTGQQKLYDEIATLKQTITSLQSKIDEINTGWESIYSSSTEEEAHKKTQKRRKKKSRNKRSLSDVSIEQRHIPLLRSPERKTNSNHRPYEEKDCFGQNPQQTNQQINCQRSNLNNQVNQQFQYNSGRNAHMMRQEPSSYSPNGNDDEPQFITVIQNRGKNSRWDNQYHNDRNERPLQGQLDYNPNDEEPQFIPVIRNRGKNSKRRYHHIRKQDRPSCPFLRKNNYCPSERCLYFHPKHYSGNYEGERNYEQDPQAQNENTRRENSRRQNHQNIKRNITCKFHLRNRCLYGRYCSYRHTETNQYP